ncbi:dual specificity mitogen-activated protein kinase kinase 1 [Aphelenchoides avenae]|nr:dual specificity mitogen-activated protein kinase kinase 1 [Aphelenchus avenae]
MARAKKRPEPIRLESNASVDVLATSPDDAIPCNNTEQLQKGDFTQLEELGNGSSGVVHKVKHIDGRLMARKSIHFSAKPETRAQILRELDLLRNCKSDNVIGFCTALFDETSLCIYMELMDMSLEDVVKCAGLVPERHITWIATSMLKGMLYLKTELSVIHRDLKPANVLVNSAGQVKLCDLGVSGTLVHSMAMSFVGTQSYMSPERLQGMSYTVQSEIWSFGIILVELAIGRYPAPPLTETELSLVREMIESLVRNQVLDSKKRSSSLQRPRDFSSFDLFECIVEDPSPELPSELFSSEFRDFTAQCLMKNDKERASMDALLCHAFLHSSLHFPVESQSEFASFVELLVSRPRSKSFVSSITTQVSTLKATMKQFLKQTAKRPPKDQLALRPD